MDRHSIEFWRAGPTGSPGDSLQKDFDALIAIFDRQLAKVPHDQSTVLGHIRQARRAAERGRFLSAELSQRLRRPTLISLEVPE
jgi:hypothetical protein